MDTPEDIETDYCLALGRFVQQYAKIEATMHQVLRIVSNSSDRTAKVMFSGTRVIAAVDFVKRFYVARKVPLPAHLTRAFGRIGEITKARDRLLHHGIQFGGRKAIVTDEARTIYKRAFKHEIRVDDLKALDADAHTIVACLISFWIEERRADLLTKQEYRQWFEIAQAPWQYKQPKPMRARDVIRGSARERKSQLPPSQE